jgi:pyridoxine 5-phosphate synthase
MNSDIPFIALNCFGKLLKKMHKPYFRTFVKTYTMTKLSVNINKIATLRNARGGNVPDVLEAARRIQDFGAEGITIHPRPDERHIRYQDARDLRKVVHTEFNIEGNPEKSFIDLVLEVRPEQVTLVPDAPDAITSNAGWDTIKHQSFLREVIAEFKHNGIRTSIFVDPIADQIEGAAQTGTDRIELYTESFAHEYGLGNQEGIKPYIEAALRAQTVGLGINAGHDLSLDNIRFFKEHIPGLLEVSIGHALIAEALYLGLENVVQLYLQKLK